MATTQNKNLEKFSVIRPSTSCERRVRERLVAIIRMPRGYRIKDSALKNVAAGVTKPTREPVKLMRRLKNARRSFAQAWNVVIEPQIKALHEEYGRDYSSGEFVSPSRVRDETADRTVA